MPVRGGRRARVRLLAGIPRRFSRLAGSPPLLGGPRRAGFCPAHRPAAALAAGVVPGGPAGPPAGGPVGGWQPGLVGLRPLGAGLLGRHGAGLGPVDPGKPGGGPLRRAPTGVLVVGRAPRDRLGGGRRQHRPLWAQGTRFHPARRQPGAGRTGAGRLPAPTRLPCRAGGGVQARQPARRSGGGGGARVVAYPGLDALRPTRRRGQLGARRRGEPVHRLLDQLPRVLPVVSGRGKLEGSRNLAAAGANGTSDRRAAGRPGALVAGGDRRNARHADRRARVAAQRAPVGAPGTARPAGTSTPGQLRHPRAAHRRVQHQRLLPDRRHGDRNLPVCALGMERDCLDCLFARRPAAL